MRCQWHIERLFNAVPPAKKLETIPLLKAKATVCHSKHFERLGQEKSLTMRRLCCATFSNLRRGRLVR